MYRIVIADDEEYVRNLLAKHINQAKGDFEVVGKAENGIQALDFIKTLKPDILITDICMPFVSGLDLIKETQEMEEPVKTVIISGYDDFSYAKTALTLGVTDYLLKPFLPEELFKVLNKIKEDLERQKVLLTNMQDMKTQFERNLSFLQERFVQKIIQDTTEEKEVLFEEGKKIRINLEANYYSAGLVRISSNLNIEEFLSIVKEHYFDHKIRAYTSSFHDNQVIIIFCGDHKNPNGFYKSIYEGVERISQSMEKYYHVHIWCALGSIYEDYQEIAVSYREAISVWQGALEHTGCITRYANVRKQKTSSPVSNLQRPKELENSLLLQVQMANRKKSLEILEDILRYYENFIADSSEFVMVSLVELVFSITNIFMASEKNVQIWEDEKVIEYLKKHFSYGSLLDVKNMLEEYISKYCERFAKVNERQGSKIVNNVKSLVEQNLDNEEFNIESVSAQLFFSHNYVRRIFKEKTGESFQEYLIGRRMNVAAELLKNPHNKVREVAEKTGYSNQRYFSSCFKKYHGSTPTEYKSRQEE